jgi:hypothetical protein
MLYNLMAGHKMQPDWVLNAHFSIELIASNQARCSIVMVSDLGRSFEARCNLLVRWHNPCREIKRAA